MSKSKSKSQPQFTGVRLVEYQIKEAVEQLKSAGIPCTYRAVDQRRMSKGAVEFLLGFPHQVKRDCIEFTLNYNQRPVERPDTGMSFKVVGISKRHRQAVLRLREPKREITRWVECWSTFKPSSKVFEGRFPISLPRGTKYKVDVKSIRAKKNRNGETTDEWKASVTATAPESDLFFLVGYDEQHMFISMLPEPVTSVKHAHEALMPSEVRGREGVIRQGEFFLVPATPSEVRKLKVNSFNDTAKLRNSNSLYYWTTNMDGETYDDYSDHEALIQYTINRETFVTGWLGNDRHFDMLEGWYKVVVNKELPNPTGQQWD